MKKIISISLCSILLIACSNTNTNSNSVNDTNLQEIDVTQESEVVENLSQQSIQIYGSDSMIVLPDSQKLNQNNSIVNEEISEYFFQSNDLLPVISSIQIEYLCPIKESCDEKSMQELKDYDSNLANYEIQTIGDFEYLTSGCLGLGNTCSSVIYKTIKDNNLVTIFVNIEDENQILSAQDLVSQIEFN